MLCAVVNGSFGMLGWVLVCASFWCSRHSICISTTISDDGCKLKNQPW